MTSYTPGQQHTTPPSSSIADQYCDLLSQLDDGKRQGMIRRLSVGFYEGWTPSRAELAVLVDFELGRISEAEFFATRQPGQAGDAERGSVDTADPAVQSPVGSEMQLAAEPALALSRAGGRSFNVDCGNLAGDFRFVATRLRGAGWTVRNEVSYRMVFLEYRLLPPARADRVPAPGPEAVAFVAAILCVPDVPAPRLLNDGRSVRHTVGPQGISGSRGPWPVAREVRLIKFVISGQRAVESRSPASPAGVLLVDTVSGRAAWKPVSGQQARQSAQN